MSDNETDDDLTGPLIIEGNVTVNDQLAVAKNIALNGRLFCLAIAAINTMAGWYFTAVFAVVPLGLSVVIDQLPPGKLRTNATIASYALAGAAAIATILNSL